MSIIKNIKHEVTRVYLDEKGKTCENHISLTVEVSESESLALVMKYPKLFNEFNEELIDKKQKNSIAKDNIMAYSVGALHFEYVLGGGDSYLDDGFKFIINYKNSDGNYFEESYIYSNGKWEREV